MIGRALFLLVALSGCTSMSTLSKATYDHEQRAYKLRARGLYEAADAEEAAAAHNRYRMARIGYSMSPKTPSVVP